MITDGEQTRLDFNLSFYGSSTGSSSRALAAARGPPAHDQRGRHASTVSCRAARPRRGGRVRAAAAPGPAGPEAEGERARAVHARRPPLPNADYPDRWALTEALLPIVREELVGLVEAGCDEITVDEPSMSCYAHREDPERFAEIFNRTVAPWSAARGSPRISASGITRRARSGRAAMRRCSRRSLKWASTRSTSRWRAGVRRVRDRRAARRAHGRRGRNRRREELLRRAAGGDRRAGTPFPRYAPAERLSSLRTAGSRRPRAGRRDRSSRTCRGRADRARRAVAGESPRPRRRMPRSSQLSPATPCVADADSPRDALWWLGQSGFLVKREGRVPAATRTSPTP